MKYCSWAWKESNRGPRSQKGRRKKSKRMGEGVVCKRELGSAKQRKERPKKKTDPNIPEPHPKTPRHTPPKKKKKKTPGVNNPGTKKKKIQTHTNNQKKHTKKKKPHRPKKKTMLTGIRNNKKKTPKKTQGTTSRLNFGRVRPPCFGCSQEVSGERLSEGKKTKRVSFFVEWD